MKTTVVLRHSESEYDRVMRKPHVEVPPWFLVLLAGVVGTVGVAAIAMFMLNVANTPTVWFTYVGPNEQGELVKVEVAGEVILAKDLTFERRKKILSGTYDIEYVDPREKK